MSFMKDLVRLSKCTDAMAIAVAYTAAGKPVPADVKMLVNDEDVKHEVDWFQYVLEYYEDVNG